MELLEKLYGFYSGRYTGEELEDKFNKAVKDLIQAGDIKQNVYIKFCIDNDIEPITNPVRNTSTTTISNEIDYGCGGGGGYTRRGC